MRDVLRDLIAVLQEAVAAMKVRKSSLLRTVANVQRSTFGSIHRRMKW
jgi:hypothetical protein